MKSTASHAFAEDVATLSKEELEKLKLRLEIHELGRPWWRKPTHLYTLLAICSLSVAFLTGRFQADSTRLDTEKAILAYRTDEFEAKRAPVQKELDQTVRDRDSNRAQLDSTRVQLASVNQELTSTRQELSSVKQDLEFSRELNSIKKRPAFVATISDVFPKNLGNLVRKPAIKSSATLSPISNSAIRFLHASQPKGTISLPQIKPPATLTLGQLTMLQLAGRPNISVDSSNQSGKRRKR